MISHGYGSGFLAEFDWTGTRDPGTWLAVETGPLDFVETIGADLLRARNNALRREAAAMLCERWGVAPPAPESMLVAMATLPMPRGAFASLPPTQESAGKIRVQLWEKHRIDVPRSPSPTGCGSASRRRSTTTSATTAASPTRWLDVGGRARHNRWR